jgi:hypothetical protein
VTADDDTLQLLKRLEKKIDVIAVTVAALAGALVGYLAYLTIERWVGASIAAGAAGAIGFGACVWILRKAD